MLLEKLALSGLYDLIKFGGKLLVGKFYTDFCKAKDYAASEVAHKYPQIFPSVNFSEYIFRLENKEVRDEVKKLTRGFETIDEKILITAIEKDLSKKFPEAKYKIEEVVSYFLECMIKKLQENHEILNYFMYKKIENIEDLLKRVKVNWSDLLSACRKQVEREVAKVGKKYIPSLYINREIEKEFEKFVSNEIKRAKSLSVKNSKNCFLIIDRAGSGKTNLLCSLAKKYVQKQPAVLILGTLSLKDEFGIEEYIKKSLEYDPNMKFSNFQQCLEAINEAVKIEHSNLLIFIDAINENTNTVLMKNAIENILSKHFEKRFKFCITCRDIYWDFFKAKFWDEYIQKKVHNQLYDFTSYEFGKALKRYFDYFNIRGELKDEAVEKCKHPLLLRFFCEAYNNTDIEVVTDIRLEELFDIYWNRKIKSIAEKIPDRLRADKQIEEYLFSIAHHMMHSNKRSIPSSMLGEITGEKNIYSIGSIYTMILDEDIILEEELIEEGKEETRVVFVYEEFMEYVMAKEIMRKLLGKSETEIEQEIDKLIKSADKFANMFGIMVYLSIILKRKRELSVWRLLIKKGIKWKVIICKSIRKLPEEEINKDVFDVLHELVSFKDVELRKKVADIFNLKKIRESMPAEAIQTLGILVKDKNKKVALRAVTALQNIGKLAIDFLIEGLKHNSIIVRRKVIKVLGEIKSESSVEPLIKALKDEDWHVREEAAEVLCKIKSERAVEPLIEALNDKDSYVRAEAAMVLGKIKSERAVEPLIGGLKDENRDVRIKVVLALGEFKSESAVEGLIEALKDKDSYVRGEALEGLGAFKSKRVEKALIDALSDESYYVRCRAAWALCGINPEKAIDFLIEALKDKDSDVRAEAAMVLGKIKSERAVEPLIEALKDKDSYVRAKAAGGLGAFKSKRVEKALIEALKDKDSYVRRKSVGVLSEFRSKRVEKALIEALKDKDSYVRRKSVGVLSEFRSKRVEEALIEALNDNDRYVREEAKRSIDNIKKKIGIRKI